MKLTSLMKKMLFSCLMLSIITQISAEQNVKNTAITTQKELTAEEKASFEKILKQVTSKFLEAALNQLKKIDSIIEDLSLATKNDIIPGADKHKILKELKAIRTIIINIRKNPFIDPDIQALYFLTNFNTTLIKSLKTSIGNNLKDVDSIYTKLTEDKNSSVDALSIEQIEKQLVNNEMLCLELDQEAQQIGLTRWNKAFRKFHNYYESGRRSNTWRYLKALTVTSFVGLTWYYKFTDYGKSEASKRGENFIASKGVKDIDDNNLLLIYRIIDNGYNPTNYEENNFIKNLFGGEILKSFQEDTSKLRKILGSTNSLNSGIFSIIEKNWHVPAFLAGGYTLIYGKEWPSDLYCWWSQRFNWWYDRQLGGVAAKKVKEQHEESTELIPKITFDDVVGLDHIKAQLVEVLEYIKDPERFDRVGIKPECGFLFTGKPGTGKSFIAEALGGEIQKIFKQIGRSSDEIGFYSINASMIKDSNGKTASQQIEMIMNLAAKEAPCVLFIDEIDLLKLQRADGDTTLLSTFLSSLSGVLSAKTNSQVIVIAATNKPENLDAALTRPGRLGKTIHFEMPTYKERKNFFIKKLQPLLPNLDYIDIDGLTAKTHNYSYKHLEGIVDLAFRKAKFNNETLAQKHLEQGVLEVAYDLISGKCSNIPVAEQKIIAAHQAGRLIATILLQPKVDITSVTIEPYNAELKEESASAQYYGPRTQKDIRYGRIFTKCNHDPLHLSSREEKINKAKIILTGAISEKIILGSSGHSYNTNDKQDALDIIKSLVFEGLHVKSMPKAIQQEYFKKALDLLSQCEKEVTKLLEKNKKNIEKVANKLLTNKTLSIEKVKKLIK